MKKKMILVALLSYVVGVYSLELSDVEPGQKTNENKTWDNILNSYVMFRQGVGAVLREVNTVLDVVESVQSQIDAIANVLETFEGIAAQCTTIVHNVANFKFDRNPIKMLNYLEEEILQKNDDLMVGVWLTAPEAIANVADKWNDLEKSVDRVSEVAKQEWDSLNTTARGITWFSWMQKETRDSVAKEMRKSYNEMLKRVMGMDANGKMKKDMTAKPEELASINIQIRREELVTNLGVHELQGERITYLAQMLIRKTKTLETINQQRYSSYYSFRDYGE